jgi:hypothetical protein
MNEFIKLFPNAKPVFIGAGGIPFDEFLDGNSLRFFV